MTGRIYRLDDDNSNLLPMEEAPYESEKLLQELLAKYPDLLAGEQINSDEPRRWVLVTREMSVPGDQDGLGKWSLDHLFIDQDAIPTLVEVKRSANTDIRRKVIGQMLDYAANAVVYWPVEEIQAKFEARCEKDGTEPEEVLAELLEEGHDVADFWQQVKTNLQAGRIRMVLIADDIPPEIRRITEFLNSQMDPAEVLAIEIKQFVGNGVKTLVPRVIGQTEAARQKKSGTSVGKRWDEQSFMTILAENKGEAARKAAKELLDWISPHVTYVWWGHGSKEGGVIPVISHGQSKFHVCRMNTQGWFVFRFDWLRRKRPFNDESVRRELLSKINSIPGIHFDEHVLTKRARIGFTTLTNRNTMEKLKEVVSWLIAKIKTESEATAG